jgi:hypothetical protein
MEKPYTEWEGSNQYKRVSSNLSSSDLSSAQINGFFTAAGQKAIDLKETNMCFTLSDANATVFAKDKIDTSTSLYYTTAAGKARALRAANGRTDALVAPSNICEILAMACCKLPLTIFCRRNFYIRGCVELKCSKSRSVESVPNAVDGDDEDNENHQQEILSSSSAPSPVAIVSTHENNENSDVNNVNNGDDNDDKPTTIYASASGSINANNDLLCVHEGLHKIGFQEGPNGIWLLVAKEMVII